MSDHQLLEQAEAPPSQTIVVSGHYGEALRAFDYGVADFVAKPWSEGRLRLAIDRATGGDDATHRRAQRLVIRKAGELQTLDVADLLFARAGTCLHKASFRSFLVEFQSGSSTLTLSC